MDGCGSRSVAKSRRVEPRTDQRIVIRSEDTGATVEAADWRQLWNSKDLRLLSLLVYFFEVRGITLTTSSQSPAGAGIAGSSALNVAVCAALADWKRMHYDPEGLLQVAMNVEAQCIKVPTGLQDYRPALYGGLAAVAPHDACATVTIYQGRKRKMNRAFFLAISLGLSAATQVMAEDQPAPAAPMTPAAQAAAAPAEKAAPPAQQGNVARAIITTGIDQRRTQRSSAERPLHCAVRIHSVKFAFTRAAWHIHCAVSTDHRMTVKTAAFARIDRHTRPVSDAAIIAPRTISSHA